MSFILEALRKSEHERQKQTGPIVANPYAPPRRAQFPLPLGWMIGIAALLAINVVVVLALALKDPALQTQPSPPPAAELPPAPPENTAAKLQTASAPVADAPAAPEPIPAGPPAPTLTAQQGPATLEAPAPPAPGSVPTINELNLRGTDALPALHLDIHVYAAKAAERFIFLNSRKYREGEQTAEGLTVEAITAGGVILNRNGLRFLLPRP